VCPPLLRYNFEYASKATDLDASWYTKGVIGATGQSHTFTVRRWARRNRPRVCDRLRAEPLWRRAQCSSSPR
jgi:hypothetical protein